MAQQREDTVDLEIDLAAPDTGPPTTTSAPIHSQGNTLDNPYDL